jgi:hypothetical protein
MDAAFEAVKLDHSLPLFRLVALKRRCRSAEIRDPRIWAGQRPGACEGSAHSDCTAGGSSRLHCNAKRHRLLVRR